MKENQKSFQISNNTNTCIFFMQLITQLYLVLNSFLILFRFRFLFLFFFSVEQFIAHSLPLCICYSVSFFFFSFFNSFFFAFMSEQTPLMYCYNYRLSVFSVQCALDAFANCNFILLHLFFANESVQRSLDFFIFFSPLYIILPVLFVDIFEH